MKHLLSINDLSRDEAILILDTAAELARISDGPMKSYQRFEDALS